MTQFVVRSGETVSTLATMSLLHEFVLILSFLPTDASHNFTSTFVFCSFSPMSFILQFIAPGPHRLFTHGDYFFASSVPVYFIAHNFYSCSVLVRATIYCKFNHNDDGILYVRRCHCSDFSCAINFLNTMYLVYFCWNALSSNWTAIMKIHRKGNKGENILNETKVMKFEK